MDRNALQLLDDLIGAFVWDYEPSLPGYYYDELLPQIVSGTRLHKLTTKEKGIVDGLRSLLSDSEWEQLPRLVRLRRDGQLHTLASDEVRSAARRQQQEQEAREAEQKRARREALEEEARRAEIEAQQKDRESREARAESSRQEGLRRQEARDELAQALEADFLAADTVAERLAAEGLVSSDSYSSLRSAFVKDWVEKNTPWEIDSDQAAAIAAHGGDVKVVARAGSGKTRTLVARAAFLIRHCRVSPDSILLLAFNREAAAVILSRLRTILGEGEDLPHAMTFHALAHALVKPEQELIFDDARAAKLWQSKRVQAVMDRELATSEGRALIRDLMFAYFREDWEALVQTGLADGPRGIAKYRKSIAMETLGGQYVHSALEKEVANTLFEHAVEYGHRWTHRYDGETCRADFTVKNERTVIDCIADGDQQPDRRRGFWDRRRDWTRLTCTEQDLRELGPSAFAERLVSQLREAGVECRHLTDDEIWKELMKRRTVDSLSKAIKMFVAKCRKSGWSPDMVLGKAASHVALCQAEDLFLRLGSTVYERYLEQLSLAQEEDFDGLLERATARVNLGKTRFSRDEGREVGDIGRLRFVMVDEFQDFATGFYDLLMAVRSVNQPVEFFCVGDDWQAINAFAGSELRYFDRFEDYFASPQGQHIPTNYRSKKEIVAIGNAIMDGRGKPGHDHEGSGGWIRCCRVDRLIRTSSEEDRYWDDEIMPAVLRLVRLFLEDQRLTDVAILMRRHGLPWRWPDPEPKKGPHGFEKRFLQRLQTHLPADLRERVAVSTVHNYKGKERDGVVLVDAVEGSFPLIHPHWVFLRIFGDSIERVVEEERRLFYVAVTRAKTSLALVTESGRDCPFLGEVKRLCRVEEVEWRSLPPPLPVGPPRVEIRVTSGTKKEMESAGFHFTVRKQCRQKYWSRWVPASSLDWESLRKSPWRRAGMRITALAEDGTVMHSE